MTIIVCRVMLKGGLFAKLTKILLNLISAILDVISLPNFLAFLYSSGMKKQHRRCMY